MKLNKYFLIGLFLGFSINAYAANKDTKEVALPKSDVGIFEEMKVQPGRHRHHIVSAKALNSTGGDSGKGLIMVISPKKHQKTGSYGGGEKAAQFRQQEANLIAQGNFVALSKLEKEDLISMANGDPKYCSPIRRAVNMIRGAQKEDGKIIWGNPLDNQKNLCQKEV